MSLLNWLFRKHSVERKELSASDRDHICAKWVEIEQLLKLGKPSQLRQAVIEADKLLELVLKRLVNGQHSLGENLKMAKDLFPSWGEYQKAWEAHKVRNALVHEPGYEPTSSVTKEAIGKFRDALVVLRAV